MRYGLFTALVWLAVDASPALAWDAHGHRTIAMLAIDAMEAQLTGAHDQTAAAELPWLFADQSRLQVGYQSGEPDRYRAIRLGQLKHENDPDHYIDVDDLKQFGLTLSTIPPLRNEYVRALVVAKHEHPENLTKPYNEKTDPARTQEWPGMLPYAILEHYGKLISSFRQVRVLNKLNDPKREFQVTAARANVIFEMGQLAHFVGDAAQPLHTTEHHHGWVGDNPQGYTTANGFHRYIDTNVLGIHHFSYESLTGVCTVDRAVNANDPWQDVLAHIQRSYEMVEPLYVLQKSGDLDRAPGKVFIEERLCDGAAMLGSMYAAAWKASAMAEKDVKDFINYDETSNARPSPMEKPGSAGTPPPVPTGSNP